MEKVNTRTLQSEGWTMESEVSGANPQALFLVLEQKLYHEWSGMVETHSLYRLVGKK